ncbi:MAG: HAD family hydrolase [Deltaproteobacteria bacterium]|nr:HAD family hydrolase [Deltaproteobacteria bacterium]
MEKNTCSMRDLAFHYEAMKRAEPLGRFMIVFDIDGTILDARQSALNLLQAYDQEQGTGFFQGLTSEDMPGAAHDMSVFLREFAFPPRVREEIAAWYEANFYTRASIPGTQRPTHGVLDVIRWFQMQPGTCVGLNTGRPEKLRRETLRLLEDLGGEHLVEFPDSLLFMNPGLPATVSKVHGIKEFRNQGYRIVAVIDSDKDNLRAMAQADPSGEMLLLHAEAGPDSSGAEVPLRPAAGHLFDLTELITEKRLPRPIELVWHGVDDDAMLRAFLVSSVQWAELHVRLDAAGRDLIVRGRRFSDLPAAPGECPARLDDFLYLLGEAGRGVKLDLKDPGLTGRVLGLLRDVGFSDERVWITINSEEVKRGGLKLIMDAFPRAIKQYPVDGLEPLMSSSPGEAREYLTMLSHSGIGRFSVNWNTPKARRIIVSLQKWGFEVNIYDVPDLESFLQAALLLPRSITAYFNFPKWFYTGILSEGERPFRMMPARMAC